LEHAGRETARGAGWFRRHGSSRVFLGIEVENRPLRVDALDADRGAWETATSPRALPSFAIADASRLRRCWRSSGDGSGP
jgi:hypothetical protein